MNRHLCLCLFFFATLFAFCPTCHAEGENKAVSARIDEVENSLLEALAIEGEPLCKKNITAEMQRHHVPAVSIAVINNGEIEWAKAYGVCQEGEGAEQKATTSTLFQAGSVSKPIAALGAHLLVQEGHLQLDQDVNCALTSWKIANNDFTKIKKVTLRHLLSHTSGINLIGFDGYKKNEPLPTLKQILNGKKPANNPPFVVTFLPGSKLAYSGGGYSVMQQLVEDTVNASFAEFMNRQVLASLNLKNSTFSFPLPEKYAPNAATSHPGDGNGGSKVLEGKWKTYPESAAAGLWSTPSDLATLLVDMQNGLLQNQSKILKKETIQEMLTPQIMPWALGPVVTYPTNSHTDMEVSHKGRTDGQACGFVFFPNLKKGAVVMTNADNGAVLLDQLFRSIAHVYSWPTYKILTKKTVQLTSSQQDAFVGRYGTESVPNDIYDLKVFKENDSLFIRFGTTQPYKLYAEAENRFFIRETGYGITINQQNGKYEDCKYELAVMIQPGFERIFRKFPNSQ